MFFIESVEIDGFWAKYSAHVNLFNDVSILIGKNGTGKTNFLNILLSTLQVDVKALTELEFKQITIKLREGKRTRTIRVERFANEHSPYDIAEYKVGTKKFTLYLYGPEFERMITRRHLSPNRYDELMRLRDEVGALINISSLSVHRASLTLQDEESAKLQKSYRHPVDQRLDDLMQKFTTYQLTLSKQAVEISGTFQRDVLTSILFDPKFDKVKLTRGKKVNIDLVDAEEKLVQAYREFGTLNEDISTKIKEHIKAIKLSLEAVNQSTESQTPLQVNDVTPFPLIGRTRHIIGLSIELDRKKREINDSIESFIEIAGEFMEGKKLQIASNGQLEIFNEEKIIDSQKLSSGEKQILILLIETLLQKKRPFVFIADEPELSLHIDWQAMVISSVRRLNPNSQIIVATHSPEIVSEWGENIIKMSDCIS